GRAAVPPDQFQLQLELDGLKMTPERAAAAEALTSQPPPGRSPARGRQEGKGDPFGTLLDQHQARTADAEGPQVKQSRQHATSTDRSQVAGRRSQGNGHRTTGTDQ